MMNFIITSRCLLASQFSIYRSTVEARILFIVVFFIEQRHHSMFILYPVTSFVFFILHHKHVHRDYIAIMFLNHFLVKPHTKELFFDH